MAVLAMTCTSCKVRVGPGWNRIDERGATEWLIEGKRYAIERTYFETHGDHASFCIEWRCTDCSFTEALTKEKAVGLVRPLAWHAIESGEVNRTQIRRMGSKQENVVDSITVILLRERDGKTQRGQVSFPKDGAGELFDQTWTIDGKPHHVYRLGFHLDGPPPGSLLLTLNWDAPEYCGVIKALSIAEVEKLATPVMREAVRRRLHEKVRPGPFPDGRARAVERIGVAITCRDAFSEQGQKVQRPLSELTGTP
jgi:hypothetical protein